MNKKDASENCETSGCSPQVSGLGIFLQGCGLLALGLFVGVVVGCRGVENAVGEGPADPGMSPITIQVTEEHPWKRAQEIARVVPQSDVVVGHGDSMMPLYPSGTVLVLQNLKIDHLRPGMTVVFQAAEGDPYQMLAEVLVRKMDENQWETATLAGENSRHGLREIDEKSYVGTVVAALNRATEDQKSAQDVFFVSSQTNLNCTIQCHLAGEIHPRVVPGIPAKITTFDLGE